MKASDRVLCIVGGAGCSACDWEWDSGDPGPGFTANVIEMAAIKA